MTDSIRNPSNIQTTHLWECFLLYYGRIHFEGVKFNIPQGILLLNRKKIDLVNKKESTVKKKHNTCYTKLIKNAIKTCL